MDINKIIQNLSQHKIRMTYNQSVIDTNKKIPIYRDFIFLIINNVIIYTRPLANDAANIAMKPI